jgi:TonB family protein
VNESLLLGPPSQLGRWLAPSAALHGALFAAALLLSAKAKPADSVQPDAFFVSAIVLPKADALPDRATYVPKKQPGQQGETAPEKSNPDEMVLKEPEKEREKGKEEEPRTPDKEPERRPTREELLARVGQASEEAHFQTDTEGDENAVPTDMQALFGRPMTAYERLVHDRVKSNWNVIPAVVSTVRKQGYAVVRFQVDDGGVIQDPDVVTGSDSYAFDMSCISAVVATGRVPPPPEAPWTFSVLFRPEEKR